MHSTYQIYIKLYKVYLYHIVSNIPENIILSNIIKLLTYVARLQQQKQCEIKDRYLDQWNQIKNIDHRLMDQHLLHEGKLVFQTHKEIAMQHLDIYLK